MAKNEKDKKQVDFSDFNPNNSDTRLDPTSFDPSDYQGEDIINDENYAENAKINDINDDGFEARTTNDNPSKVQLNQIMSAGRKKAIAQNQQKEDAAKKAKKVGFISLTGKYWIKKWHIAIFVVLFCILSSACTAVGPLMIKWMIAAVEIQNKVTGYQQMTQPLGNLDWHQYMGIELGLLGLTAIAQFGSTLIAGFLGKKIEIDLRNKTIEKLILQDMSYYSDKKIGDILTKVVSDTQILGDQSQLIPVSFLNAVFTALGAVVILFVIDWRIALITIGFFAVVFIFVGASYGGLRKLIYKMRDVITKINGTVLNRIATVQLIKTTGTEEYEKKKFSSLHDEYETAYEKAIRMQTIVITILIMGITVIEAVITACTVGVYEARFGHKNATGELALTLPSIMMSVGTLVGPVMQIVRVISGMTQASSSAERIAEILFEKSRIDDHLGEGQGIYIKKLDGPIKFDHVTFAYPEKPEKVIIPHFDFTFEQGKSYAFVGETGSGKSTVSRLLLRFYDPTYGAVLINGKTNLKDIHMPSYLEHVGYVEQEPQILLGDVYENVRYGTHGKTDKEVEEACKKAELDKIVKSWPKGYKTVLGERGFMLSGGQKQRLVIARMFLKDPELLILDEATSALDNIVEKEIQTKLNQLMKGRTTVSIAHRLSTIKNADEVIVLAPGKGVIQQGTFKELASVKGHFKDLLDAGGMK